MATYQAFIAPIANTLANWQLWGQFWGAGFTTIGWVAQTGHGEVTATGTGASYTWTGIPGTAPTTALTQQVAYVFKGAWVSGATYVGSNTAGSTTEVDVVTSAGITYVHITATSSLTTAPASDTTNWQPLIFEVWKSNGANFPIYIKIIYTLGSSATSAVGMLLSVGTGIDANGNITNPILMTNGGVPQVRAINNSSNSSATLAECDFSGDSDNVRWCVQRGQATIGYFSFFFLDRSRTSTGSMTNGYAYFGHLSGNGGTLQSSSSVMMNPSYGTANLMNNFGGGGFVGLVSNFTFTSSTFFGSFPVYPIFPIVGCLANPCLGAVGFSGGDVADGVVTTATIFGATHSYLVCSTFKASASGCINALSNGICPALLWE